MTINPSQPVNPTLGYPSLASTLMTDTTAEIYPTLPYRSSTSHSHQELQNLYPIPQIAIEYHPSSCRQPSSATTPYQFSIPTTNAKKVYLNTLESCLSKGIGGFNPWGSYTDHPIHTALSGICNDLLQDCQNQLLSDKIPYLENAIAELLLDLVGTNQPEYLQIQALIPKFELLEIALRHHLHEGLVEQEKSAINTFYQFNRKFPDNLAERENALYQFVTKNQFYYCNYPHYSTIYQDLLQSPIKACVNKAVLKDSLDSTIESNEKLIEQHLTALQLTTPSVCSLQFEATVREEMAKKTITHFTAQYRRQFQKEGTIDSNKLLKDITKLEKFLTANDKIYSLLQVKLQVIGEIFELPYPNDRPFDAIRDKIIQAQDAKANSSSSKKPSSKRSIFNWRPFHSAKTLEQQRNEEAELVAKQLSTLDWAEEQWNLNSSTSTIPSALLIPDEELVEQIILPSAPPQEEDSITSEETPVVDLEETVSDQPVVLPSVLPKIITPPVMTSYTPQDLYIPIISYVNLSFEELFNRGNDQQIWDALPQIVQKDVLRHVFYRPSLKGKAEELALRCFNTGSFIKNQIDSLNKKHFASPTTGLGKDFITNGEELIDFYYSDKIVSQFSNFINRFRALPKEPLFYQYVYEMAKSANVHIESWDHHFAEYNWDQPGILHLSVQALERCLHTERKN